jgi:hypothetical protein
MTAQAAEQTPAAVPPSPPTMIPILNLHGCRTSERSSAGFLNLLSPCRACHGGSRRIIEHRSYDTSVGTDGFRSIETSSLSRSAALARSNWHKWKVTESVLPDVKKASTLTAHRQLVGGGHEQEQF